MYKYKLLQGISESREVLFQFFFIIERDEIRRSINKTNIHAFLKHYYYKYWLTPWQTPCTRKKTHSRLTRSTTSLYLESAQAVAFHHFSSCLARGRC